MAVVFWFQLHSFVSNLYALFIKRPPLPLPPQPVEGLASTKELAEAVRSHPGTTAEIRTLCADLQVC